MLKELKLLLGIAADDTSKDAVLSLLISTATARLKLRLGGLEPPESMDHIIREAAVVRFNRIGSEGMGSHTVEGESVQFDNSDFDSFADEIQAYLETQKSAARGRVKFL